MKKQYNTILIITLAVMLSPAGPIIAIAGQGWGDVLYSACSMDPDEWCKGQLTKLCGQPNSKSSIDCAKRHSRALFCKNWERNVKPYRLCGNPALVEQGPEAVKKCIKEARYSGCIR